MAIPWCNFLYNGEKAWKCLRNQIENKKNIKN